MKLMAAMEKYLDLTSAFKTSDEVRVRAWNTVEKLTKSSFSDYSLAVDLFDY